MKAPPVVLDVAGLRFCANRGVGDLSCCDAAADAALESRFEAMGINRTGGGRCAGLIKFIICESQEETVAVAGVETPGWWRTHVLFLYGFQVSSRFLSIARVSFDFVLISTSQRHRRFADRRALGVGLISDWSRTHCASERIIA
uniref:Uncharacterized protein n=1 Tax=Oryza brachyantha TaxID=4533 RepID=J3NDX5_ORYBR